MCFCDTSHAKSSVLQHSREAAATISNPQRLCSVVPMDGDDRVRSVFIVVIIAFVIV